MLFLDTSISIPRTRWVLEFDRPTLMHATEMMWLRLLHNNARGTLQLSAQCPHARMWCMETYTACDRYTSGRSRVAGMEGWVWPCQDTLIAKAPTNNQMLLNSNAFFPTADSVYQYCKTCSSLSCCLICSRCVHLANFWAISHYVLDKTGSLPVSFPVQIIYRIVSYCMTNWLSKANGTAWAQVDALSEQTSKQALASYLSSDQSGICACSCSVGGSPPHLSQLNYLSTDSSAISATAWWTLKELFTAQHGLFKLSEFSTGEKCNSRDQDFFSSLDSQASRYHP